MFNQIQTYFQWIFVHMFKLENKHYSVKTAYLDHVVLGFVAHGIKDGNLQQIFDIV